MTTMNAIQWHKNMAAVYHYRLSLFRYLEKGEH